MTADLHAALRAERARILAIVTSPLVDGRLDLAWHIAFLTDMPWEQALELLAISATSSEMQPSRKTLGASRERRFRMAALGGKKEEGGLHFPIDRSPKPFRFGCGFVRSATGIQSGQAAQTRNPRLTWRESSIVARSSAAVSRSSRKKGHV